MIEQSAPTVDLHHLIGADVPLQHKTRHELAGPCPRCGGRDRFVVNTATGRWFCRQCSPRWGDGAGYLMWRDDISYPAALEALGDVPPAPAHPLHDPRPDEPSESFRQQALEAVRVCHERLAGGDALAEKARGYLNNRGLGGNAIAEFRVGYCPGKPGDTAAIAGLRVPCGVTIPMWGYDGKLWGISVRRAARPKDWNSPADWRYKELYGSMKPLFGRPQKKRGPLLLVEGYFDAILLQWAGEGLLDVAALGCVKGGIESRWDRSLIAYSPWLICMDSDEVGSKAAQATANATAGWIARSARSQAVRVPEGKDATEYWQALAQRVGSLQATATVRSWLASLLVEPWDDAVADDLCTRIVAVFRAWPEERRTAEAWQAIAERMDHAGAAHDLAALRLLAEEVEKS